MAAAVLSGFPTVIAVRAFQGTTARPGRFVVDTVVDAGYAGQWPSLATLQMEAGGSTLTWPELRVVSAPRARGSYMRTVLEDNRWKLRAITAGECFNLRDGAGNLVGTQYTAGQLAQSLGSTADLNILPGSVAPDIIPPADWRGVRGDRALAELLRDSVSRLIYNPITQAYSLWKAGAGSQPNADQRLFRANPDGGLAQITVRSAPVLHEGRLACTAVFDNGQGEIENVADNTPNGYFDGFEDVTDEGKRSRLKEVAFRLWRVNAASDKEILPHRALSVTPAAGGPGFADSRLIAPDLFSQMRHYNVRAYGGDEQRRSIYGKGDLFISDEPFLMSTGGDLSTTGTLLCGYYKLTDGQRERRQQVRAIGLGQGNRVFDVDWIRPIESSESDVSGDEWTTLHNDVADALRLKHGFVPTTLHLPGLPNFLESGHVSAVTYNLRLFPERLRSARTTIALDFDLRQTMVR